MDDRETLSMTLDPGRPQRVSARGVQDLIDAERSSARRRKGKEPARREDEGVLDVDGEDMPANRSSRALASVGHALAATS